MNNPLTYDHLPYITAAYTLFLLTWLWLILSARHRLTQAQTRLNAIDPRQNLPRPLAGEGRGPSRSDGKGEGAPRPEKQVETKAPFSLPPAGRAARGGGSQPSPNRNYPPKESPP